MDRFLLLKNLQISKSLGILLLLFIFTKTTFAHAAIIDLESMSRSQTALLYTKLGFQHILPLGLDHILFVVSIFLISPALKPVLWQATAFTVAHTFTLGLSMYKVVNPPTAIVEPLIALSILYVALENIFSNKLKASRIGVVFLFGLVHGLGFASALSQLGLPQNAYFTSLVMFNMGVELGQITVILAAYFLLAKWFGNKLYYRNRVVIPLSAVIAVIAFYWTIERIFFT
jgi:HupE / UreJ protein